MERLQKVISEAGIASRRGAEKLIQEGKVLVNGSPAIIGQKVSGNDEILVDGKKVKKEDKVYYLLNKPRGVICSLKDKEGRRIVTDLIDTKTKIYPVGRLDYDTTGAIILTNDGELTNILEHPRNEIPRTYLVKCLHFFSKDDKKKLEKGVIIDGQKCTGYYIKLKKYDKKSDKSYVNITLKEGHNHEVKNMFNEIGHPVDKLSRESFADLSINNMKSGEYRLLTIKEVKRLYSLKKVD